MQSLIMPRSGGAPPRADAVSTSSSSHLRRINSNLCQPYSSLSPLSSSSPNMFKTLYSQNLAFKNHGRKTSAFTPIAAVPNDEFDTDKLAQVSKRLEYISRYFKRLGSFGFWGQLICSVVAGVILSFSKIITGKVTSPASFYATFASIAAAFISVFWSFGHIRLADMLRRTGYNPSKAPARADVVRSLNNGIVLNLLGMGAAVFGMQATVCLLVAKALTSSANPFYQGIPPGNSPVLALDVFLVQASANTILSHFLGLICSLELLRSVTISPSEGARISNVAQTSRVKW